MSEKVEVKNPNFMSTEKSQIGIQLHNFWTLQLTLEAKVFLFKPHNNSASSKEICPKLLIEL